ncbi:phage tail assembly protein [Nocardia sp. NPDC001965]
MSNSYSLDDLRAGLDKKFAPLPLTLKDGSTAVLQNLLRLPSGVRKEVTDTLKTIRKDEDGESKDSDEILAATQKVIELVTKDRKGKKLVSEIGDDLALTSEIIRMWTEATQPGEAQPSHG